MREKECHPWRRSLSEVSRFIENFTNPSDFVFCPCGGGFTTAVASKNLKRRCVSCDIEKDCVAGSDTALDSNTEAASIRLGKLVIVRYRLLAVRLTVRSGVEYK